MNVHEIYIIYYFYFVYTQVLSTLPPHMANFQDHPSPTHNVSNIIVQLILVNF